ncbi:hypothetical protein D3C87_2152980 [compost metagenome]
MPLGRVCVTTAATFVASVSERLTDPAPSLEAAESSFSSESALAPSGRYLSSLFS